ncbi:MAG TPA: beta-N-acetylglucosaminidase domain-containing protein [Longimicrobiales bacterium]
MIRTTALDAAPLAPLPARARCAALLFALVTLVAASCARPPAPGAPNPTPAVAPIPGLPPGVGTPANPMGTGFQTRGVIEGFYGPPWSYQDRLDMLRFMGKVGLNTYFYAPKDDPYHRDRWRDSYPAEDIARLAELVRVGREAGVNTWFAISPGLSMTYSSDADYAALLAKLDAVRAVGVRDVGLFLDDVPETLLHAEDRARFSSLAQAHAFVIKRLKADLDARGMGLLVAQTTYTNVFGSRDYLKELGALLPPSIPLIWTGVDVRSFDITVPEAQQWGTWIRRKPAIWDNYPVNDFSRWREFLGPITGRAPGLEGVVDGYVANPMNEAHASMLPLWTIADYLRDPLHYDAAASEARALQALYGNASDPVKARQGVAAMKTFAEVYPTGMWPGPVDALWVPARGFDYTRALAAVNGMHAALDTMRALATSDSATWWPLVKELTPFADSAAARLQAARSDSLYRLRGDSLLFRAELDRVTAEKVSVPPTIDGELDDWGRSPAWRPMLVSGVRPGFTPRVALRADAGTLYLALDVPDTAVAAFAGDSTTQGDHVEIVVGDPEGRETRLSPQDLVLLATPATATRPAAITAWSFTLTPFYSQVLAARGAPISPFALTNFKTALPASFSAEAAGARVASQRDAGGWHMEIALPRGGLPVAHTPAGDVLHVSIAAVDAGRGAARVASLGLRNYPLNPTTYTEVLLPR